MSQPGLSGPDDGLGSIRHLQFAEDVGDVVLHRFRTEHLLFGDFGIAMALGNQGQNFTLALCEFRE